LASFLNGHLASASSDITIKI